MNMINDVLGFLRKPATGSEALRAKLAEIVEAIPQAEAEAARLAAERAGKLLSADDREIERIEKAGADARRSLDRLHAARDELARRLAIAEADEARAALDAERAEAEKIAVAIAGKVKDRYPKIGRELASLILELEAAEAAVARVNVKLADADRADECLPEVESRALPEPAEVFALPFKLRSASLPPAPTLGFDGLGLARERAEIAGVVEAMIG